MDHPAKILNTDLKFSPKWGRVLMVHLNAYASNSVQNDKWQNNFFKIKILFSNQKSYIFPYRFFRHNQKNAFSRQNWITNFPPKP